MLGGRGRLSGRSPEECQGRKQALSHMGRSLPGRRSSRGKGPEAEAQPTDYRALARTEDRRPERRGKRGKDVQVICGLTRAIISSGVFTLGDRGPQRVLSIEATGSGFVENRNRRAGVGGGAQKRGCYH